MDDLSPLRGWFSLTGRRARLSYFLASLALCGVAGVAAFLGVLPLIAYGQQLPPDAGLTMLAGVGALLIFAAVLFGCVGSSFLIAQRSRDMGWSPAATVGSYWILFALGFLAGFANGINPGSADGWEVLVNIVSLMFGLILLFKRGAEPRTFAPLTT